MHLDDSTRRMLRAMLDMDMDHQMLTSLLDIMLLVPPPLSRYMGGPVIVGKTAWAETLPKRAIKAALLDRLDRVLDEWEIGEIGDLATPAEVLCVMYPYSMVAPMHHEYVDLYMWCFSQVAPRHRWSSDLATAEDYWQFIQHPPISFEYVCEDYNRVARDIRRKVVDAGKSRGFGNLKEYRKRKTEQEARRSAEVALRQLRDTRSSIPAAQLPEDKVAIEFWMEQQVATGNFEKLG